MPKITQLTADTSPTSDDLAVIVNDPSGTPGTKKATLANVITKAHGLSDGIVSAGSGTLNTNLSLDTDGTLAANSDTKIASQKATKTYTDNILGNANALVYKGVIDCSANPNYPAADAGFLYVVSVAGKIGGASGIDVEVGDMVICNTDGTASGDQATVGQYWNVIQKNIVGAVTGPASAVTDNIAVFDGTTGKVIKDGGAKTADFITKALIDAKGDLIVGTAADTPAILTSSATNGNVLTVDTSTATGLKWAAPAAGGQTLYDKVVATSGGDYTTLQDALAAASNGETIFVKSGTFALAANVSNTLNDITIIGENPYTSVINNSTYTLSLTGTRIKILNLGFSLANTAGNAVRIDNSNDNVIDNCIFTSSTRNVMLSARGSITNNIFRNSSTTSNANTLIDLQNTATRFNNNFIEFQVVGSGVVVAADSMTANNNYFNGLGHVDGNTVTYLRGPLRANNNIFLTNAAASNSGGRAIIAANDGPTYSGNFIRGSFDYGITTTVAGGYTRKASITGNTIQLENSSSSSAAYGINIRSSATFSESVSISGNSVDILGTGSSRFPCYVADGGGGMAYVSISGNIFKSDSGDALRVASGTDISIVGNALNSSNYKGLNISGATKTSVVGNNIKGTSTSTYTDLINTNSNRNFIAGNIGDLQLGPFNGNASDSVTAEFLRNTSGSTINANSAVVTKATANGTEIETTTTAGNNKVYGVVNNSTSNNNWAYVVTKGKVNVLADATTAIAIGDWLTCHTTAGYVKKAAAGDTVIGQALAALASGTGTISMNVMTPRLI